MRRNSSTTNNFNVRNIKEMPAFDLPTNTTLHKLMLPVHDINITTVI